MSKKNGKQTDPPQAGGPPSLAAIFEAFSIVQGSEAVAKRAKARVADAKSALEEANASFKGAKHELAADLAEMMERIGQAAGPAGAAGGKDKKKKPAAGEAMEAEGTEGKKKNEQAA